VHIPGTIWPPFLAHSSSSGY